MTMSLGLVGRKVGMTRVFTDDGSAVPVTKSLARLQKYTAAPARSAGSPQRRAGVRATTRSCMPGITRRAPCVSSVSMKPGRMLLTWMLSFAHAAARLFVSCTTAPLVAAYTGPTSKPKMLVIEPMVTILPPPRRFISG